MIPVPNVPFISRDEGDERLHRLVPFGETAKRKAVNQYLEHYHAERCHQGLGNNLIVTM